jgi:hypothetical protein
MQEAGEADHDPPPVRGCRASFLVKKAPIACLLHAT